MSCELASVERFMLAIGEIHEGRYSVDESTGMLKTESGYVMEPGWIAYVERYHKKASVDVLNLQNAEDCAVAAVRARTMEDEREMVRHLIEGIWTLAGHVARLSHAFGRDPDPPKDPKMPF